MREEAGAARRSAASSWELQSEKRAGTDDFSEQDDVLASDEKHAAVGLGVRPRRRVEQPFDRLRQDQVGYTYYGAARGQPSVLFCFVTPKKEGETDRTGHRNGGLRSVSGRRGGEPTPFLRGAGGWGRWVSCSRSPDPGRTELTVYEFDEGARGGELQVGERVHPLASLLCDDDGGLYIYACSSLVKELAELVRRGVVGR